MKSKKSTKGNKKTPNISIRGFQGREWMFYLENSFSRAGMVLRLNPQFTHLPVLPCFLNLRPIKRVPDGAASLYN